MEEFVIRRRNNLEERQWDILFEQIVRGNVIPVIGPDFVHVNDKTSIQFLIDVISQYCQIGEGQFSSYSQLINDNRYQTSELNQYSDIYASLTDLIYDNPKFFCQETENALLYKFLSVPYFTFVITTTFDPVVENMMKKIHGERLRVMYFRNDASRNDDLINGEDMRRPTLFYMFGKAERKEHSFVVTDEDLLQFSQTWLRPNDSGCKAKPAMISNLLANRYLLVVGQDFQDWLFRFFWYAMKNENFGKKMSGMLSLKQEDKKLIEFLSRCNAFTRIEPNLEKFVNKVVEGVEAYERNNNISRDTIPQEGTDVFISYSRGDNDIVEILYNVLTEKGLHVWYDHESLHKGLDFMKQIENAIKNSTFFIPVFTPTILAQAQEEHPYRQEWRYAVNHILNIGGISYCFPFFEEGFNMDDMKADIPGDLKKHDAFSFVRSTVAVDAGKMADYLINELEERKRNGGR